MTRGRQDAVLGAPEVSAERDAEHVRQLIARAGVAEPGPGGGGTLRTEALLVYRGLRGRRRLKPGRTTTEIFDQHGRVVGSAEGTETNYQEVGYHSRYQLRDTEVVAEFRETTKRGFGSVFERFSVLAADGSEIATAVGEVAGTYAFSRASEVIATVRVGSRMARLRARPAGQAASLHERLQRIYDRVNCTTFHVENAQVRHADGKADRVEREALFLALRHLRDRASVVREIARIETFPSDNDSYVVTIDPSFHEPLRTIAVITPFLIANWHADGVSGVA